MEAKDDGSQNQIQPDAHLLFYTRGSNALNWAQSAEREEEEPWPLGGAAACMTGSRYVRLSGSGSFTVFCCVCGLQSPPSGLPSHCYFLAAQMYRAPVRPQRSPGAPRPAGRFPSPASSWGFPGDRSPYGGSGHRGGSPRGCPAYSPVSPVYSPDSNQGYRDGGGSRGFGDSPSGFGGGFGGHMRHRGCGFRRPQSFSPASAQNFQCGVEKYFSPSMLQDPWAALQPVAGTHAARQIS
ncbi:M-phase-specific PLK1-interacting protein [Cottoperca gobio]|uniref:M-phase-specific PLK1-interacting protein n=1 Tax=Cottoperca gobio TaxID=56716 RepID=A0A6J2P9E7_COTGO|nr:M-phase-specific PLK1-interacting protein [Cottoperca gobio]